MPAEDVYVLAMELRDAITAKLQTVATGLQEVKDSYSEMGAKTTEVSAQETDAVDKVTGALGKQAEAARALADAQNRLQQATFDSAAAQKKLAEAQNAVAVGGGVDAEEALALAKLKVSKASVAEAKATAGVAQANKDAESASHSYGAATALVWGSIAAVGAISVSMAASFDQLSERLVTTAGESQSAIGSVKSAMLDLSAQTGVTANQTAQAMYTVESAGFHAGQGMQVLKAAEEGAVEEGASTQTMADALTSALNAYGMGADHATQMTNEMLTAVSEGKMNLQDFAGSLSTVLPVAAAVHISFDQVSGAVATMTAQGMSAQQATQDLANAIRSLDSPSQLAQSEMQQLGINVTDLEQNLGARGLTGTFGILSDAITSHMGPAGLVLMNAMKQSQAATSDLKTMLGQMPASIRQVAENFLNATPGTAGYASAMKAMRQEGGPMTQQFLALYNKANGFNDLLKSGSPAAQTYAAALQKLTGNATTMNTMLLLTGAHAATFADNVAGVGKAAQNTGDDVNNWAQVQASAAVSMTRVKTTAQELMIRLGSGLLPIVANVAGAVLNLTKWFENHHGAAIALAIVIGTLVTALTAAWVITRLHSAAIMIAEGATKAWSAATKMAEAAQWAFSAAMDASPIILLVLAIAALIAGIVLLVTHWSQVTKVLGDAFRPVVKWLVGAFNDVKHAIGDAIGWIGDHLALIGTIIATVLLGPLGLMVAMVVTHFSQIVSFIHDLPGHIWSILKGAATWLVKTGIDVISGLVTGFITNLPFMIGWILGLPVKILILLADANIWLVETGINVLKGLVSGLVTALVHVVGFFHDLPGHIWDTLKFAGTWLIDTGGQILAGLVSAFVTGLVRVLGFFHDLPGHIWDALTGAGTWLTNTGTSVVQGFLNGLWGAMKWVWNFIWGVPGAFWDAFKDAGTWLLQIGQDVVNGFLNGLKGAWNGVTSWVHNAPGEIANGFKSVLGINSPSVVFAEIGKNTMAGYNKGLLDEFDKTRNLTANLTATTVHQSTLGSVSAAQAGSAQAAAASASGSTNIFDFRGSQMMSDSAMTKLATKVGEVFAEKALPGAGRFLLRTT